METTQMMKSKAGVAAAWAAAVLVAALAGCEKGPAERAGRQVDQAVDKAGRQVEKAGDRIQDAARDAKK
jgi:hypothetical protein